MTAGWVYRFRSKAQLASVTQDPTALSFEVCYYRNSEVLACPDQRVTVSEPQLTAGTWVPFGFDTVAPTGATHARIKVTVQGGSQSQGFLIDDAGFFAAYDHPAVPLMPS